MFEDGAEEMKVNDKEDRESFGDVDPAKSFHPLKESRILESWTGRTTFPLD